MRVHARNAVLFALASIITMIRQGTADEMQSFGIFVPSHDANNTYYSSSDPLTLSLCYNNKLYECEGITPNVDGAWHDCAICQSNDWFVDQLNYEICSQYEYDLFMLNNANYSDKVIISKLRYTTQDEGEIIIDEFCLPSDLTQRGTPDGVVSTQITGVSCETFGVFAAEEVYDWVKLNRLNPFLVFVLDAVTQRALLFEEYLDPDEQYMLFQVQAFTIHIANTATVDTAAGQNHYASVCFNGHHYECTIDSTTLWGILDMNMDSFTCYAPQWTVTVDSAACDLQNEPYGTLFFVISNDYGNDLNGIITDEITIDFTNGTSKSINRFCIDASSIDEDDLQGQVIEECFGFGSYGYLSFDVRDAIEIVPSQYVALYFDVFEDNDSTALTTYNYALDIDLLDNMNKRIVSFSADAYTYESAQYQCVKKGGRLATTASPFQQTIVGQKCNDVSTTGCWFGNEYRSPPNAFGFRVVSSEAVSTDTVEYTLCYEGISYECAEPVTNNEYLCTIDSSVALSVVRDDVNCVNSKYYFINIVNIDMNDAIYIESVFIFDEDGGEHEVNDFISTQSMDELNYNTNYNDLGSVLDEFETSWTKFSGLGSAFDVLYYSVGRMVVYLDYNIEKGLVSEEYIDPNLLTDVYYATLWNVDGITTTETEATSATSDAFVCAFSNVYEFGILTATIGSAFTVNEYTLSLCYYGFSYVCSVTPGMLGAYYVCDEDNWSMASNDVDCALNRDKMSVTIANVDPVEDTSDYLIIAEIHVSTTLSTIIKSEFCVDGRDASISMGLNQNSDMKPCSLSNDYGLYSIPYNYVFDEIKLAPTLNTQCTIYFDNVDTNNALVTDHYIDDNSFANHLHFVSFESTRRTSLYPESLCSNKGGALVTSQTTDYGNYIVDDVLCDDADSEYCISCQFSKIESFSVTTADAEPPPSLPSIGLCFYGIRYLCNGVQLDEDTLTYTCDDVSWTIEFDIVSATNYCNWDSKFMHLFLTPSEIDVTAIDVLFMDGTAFQKTSFCQIYLPDDIDVVSFTDTDTYTDTDCTPPPQSSSDFIFTVDSISTRAMSVDTDSASVVSALDTYRIPVSFGITAYNTGLSWIMRLCYEGYSYECLMDTHAAFPLCTIDSWDASLDSSVNQCPESYNWILLEQANEDEGSKTLRIGYEDTINAQINFNDGSTIYSQTFCHWSDATQLQSEGGSSWAPLGPCSTWAFAEGTMQKCKFKDLRNGAVVYLDEDLDDAFFIDSVKQTYYQRPYTTDTNDTIEEGDIVHVEGTGFQDDVYYLVTFQTESATAFNFNARISSNARVIRNTRTSDGAWGTGEDSGGMQLSTNAADAMAFEFKLTDTNWEVTYNGNRIPDYDYSHRVTGDITDITTTNILDPIITVTTPGEDMALMKAFGFYLINIELGVDIQLFYTLCHDGLFYECDYAELSASNYETEYEVMCDANHWSIDKNESTNGCGYQETSEDHLHLTIVAATTTLPFKFAMEYMVFEYTDGTEKTLYSFCLDAEDVFINNYIIVSQYGYPNCDDLYCVQGYTLSQMHTACDSLKDCIGFGYPTGVGATPGEIYSLDSLDSDGVLGSVDVGDGCFKQNGFCEYEYLDEPSDIVFRQKITSDMYEFDTYPQYTADPYELYSDYVVPYNISNRTCTKWISSAEHNAWDVFPMGNTMLSAGTEDHYDAFLSDFTFYFDSDQVDEVLVTRAYEKQFEEPFWFGFTIAVYDYSEDEFVVRLCVYDSGAFVSYECIIMPSPADAEYFCTRGSWTINLNDENCEGYEEYTTIFIKSVTDSQIGTLDILDVYVVYRNGDVVSQATFCVDDMVEGFTEYTNNDCDAWYYGARNPMYKGIRLGDNHQSVFYLDPDREHALVALDYLSTEDLLEPDSFGIYVGGDASEQEFDFAMCWKGVEFLCPDIVPNQASTWFWCDAGWPWDIRFGTAACLADTHHDSIRIFNSDMGQGTVDSLKIRAAKIVLMNDDEVYRWKFCVDDTSGEIEAGAAQSTSCYQWKAGFNDGGLYSWFTIDSGYQVVIYFSEHEGVDSALAASSYLLPSELVQPIQFGFKVSGDSSGDSFVIHMCYDDISFVCTAGVVPDAVHEWEYCTIADYVFDDDPDEDYASNCESSDYDYVLITADCLDDDTAMVCDSLGIEEVSVLFNDGTSMRKDTFCIQRDDEETDPADHHQGALANGASCLSFGLGNVYENIIIRDPQSTYLYWEHMLDTQPLLVASVMQTGAALAETFMDIEVVHNANGNYAKLVPAEALMTSWEEANQYCQAYGYLGLATILSSDLNDEAAELCASTADECWIGAYVLHGLCDADDTDVIKCWKWTASYNAAFVYSNWADTDNDDLSNFNSDDFVYGYLDDALWHTVTDKTEEHAYGILCDITLKSTQINDQWSSVTCNNDASKALFAGLFNIDEAVLTNLDATISALTETQRIQEHIICTEGVYKLLNAMNPLQFVIKGINTYTAMVNLVLDGIDSIADALDINGIANAITVIKRTINNGIEAVVAAVMGHSYSFSNDAIVDLTDFYYDLLKYLSKALCDELIPDIEGKLETIKNSLFDTEGTGVLDELTDAIEASLGIDPGSTPAPGFEHVTFVGSGDRHLDFTVAINIGVIICYDQMKWYLCVKKSYNVAVDLHQIDIKYEARSLYFEGPYGEAGDISFNLGFSLPMKAFVEFDFIPRLESISDSPNFFELGIAVNWPASYVDEIMDKALPIIGVDDLQFSFLPPFLNELIAGDEDSVGTWSVGLIGDFSQNLISLHCGGFRLSLRAGKNVFAVHLSANFRAELGSIDYGMDWMDDIHLGEFRGVTNRLLDGFNLIGALLEEPLNGLKDKLESFALEIGNKLKDGAIDAINEVIDGLNAGMCAIIDLLNIIFAGIQDTEDMITRRRSQCRDSILRRFNLHGLCNGFFDPIRLLLPNVNLISCSPVDTIRRRRQMSEEEGGKKIDMHAVHQIKLLTHEVHNMHRTPSQTVHIYDEEEEEDDGDAVMFATVAAEDGADNDGEVVVKSKRMSTSALLVFCVGLVIGSVVGFKGVIIYSKKMQTLSV
eukprot:43292_1